MAEKSRSLLVTRPEGTAAQRLCALLAKAGYEVHHQAMLELRALQDLPVQARQRMLDLDTYQHVIFVSANAVQFGLDQLGQFWPQWPVGVSWYAVGEATAAQLAKSGIEAVTPGAQMTSEGLLALPQLKNIAGDKVLIIKGIGGRSALLTELEGRGARVDELACYERLRPRIAPADLAARLAACNTDVVLFSSGEGMANFAQLLSPAETTTLKSLCVVVPSARVAATAWDFGFEHIVVADNASDAAMLRAVEKL